MKSTLVSLATITTVILEQLATENSDGSGRFFFGRLLTVPCGFRLFKSLLLILVRLLSGSQEF